MCSCAFVGWHENDAMRRIALEGTGSEPPPLKGCREDDVVRTPQGGKENERWLERGEAEDLNKS